MKHLLGLAVATATLALVGCGGNTINQGQTGGPCRPPSGTTTVLVYPANGSTQIPDALSGVVLGSTATLPANFQAVLAPQGQSPNAGFGFSSVLTTSLPLPNPNTVPAFANPVYQTSTNSSAVVFNSAQTIDVYLNDGNSNCTPSILGSFTTQ